MSSGGVGPMRCRVGREVVSEEGRDREGYSQWQDISRAGYNKMLEKSDIILKHNSHSSPFSIESLLGRKSELEDGPCVSVSPPGPLQTPFIFPQLVPAGQLPSQAQLRSAPEVFLPQNFPFDLLARGL